MSLLGVNRRPTLISPEAKGLATIIDGVSPMKRRNQHPTHMLTRAKLLAANSSLHEGEKPTAQGRHPDRLYHLNLGEHPSS
jgi:hypothetical protein